MPHEADSILVVDSNAVLAETFALQSFQIVTSCSRKIAELPCCIQRFQFPPRGSLYMPQRWYILLLEKSFGVGIAKALDH